MATTLEADLVLLALRGASGPVTFDRLLEILRGDGISRADLAAALGELALEGLAEVRGPAPRDSVILSPEALFAPLGGFGQISLPEVAVAGGAGIFPDGWAPRHLRLLPAGWESAPDLHTISWIVDGARFLLFPIRRDEEVQYLFQVARGGKTQDGFATADLDDDGISTFRLFDSDEVMNWRGQAAIPPVTTFVTPGVGVADPVDADEDIRQLRDLAARRALED